VAGTLYILNLLAFLCCVEIRDGVCATETGILHNKLDDVKHELNMPLLCSIVEFGMGWAFAVQYESLRA
jgi:hypothetical protein